MKTIKVRFIEFVSYFFILLFCYAGISKIMDFENFQIQISQSLFLSKYARFIPFVVIILELIIAGLLCYRKTRNVGMIGSFILMLVFTGYIALILSTTEKLPCSCGGILEKMSWNQHLIFNIGCVLLAAIALAMNIKYSRPAR